MCGINHLTGIALVDDDGSTLSRLTKEEHDALATFRERFYEYAPANAAMTRESADADFGR